MDESQRIDKVELVYAEHNLIGKYNASSRGNVQQDVQDSLELVACQGLHGGLPNAERQVLSCSRPKALQT